MKLFSRILLFFSLLLVMIPFASCGQKDSNKYFYFKDSVIEMNVGDSIELSSTNFLTNLALNDISLVCEGGIETNDKTIIAKSSGVSFVYVCYNDTRLARLQINVYYVSDNTTDTDPSVDAPPIQEESKQQENFTEITYSVRSVSYEETTLYTINIFKLGEGYGNFTYECANTLVDINKSFYTLYITSPINLSFEVTIRDKSQFLSLIISLP